MSRSHPLSILSEREWVEAWESEQRALDRLRSQRGSWLPNIVEVRDWGALRWTSGRPAHAASSGQAVAETFAVVRPDLSDRTTRNRILESLRDRPPVLRFLGFGFREHHLRGAAFGAAGGCVLVAAVAAMLGAGGLLVLAAAVAGVVGGGAAGVIVRHYGFKRARAAVLADAEQVRTVTGQFAPEAWSRLVEAATVVATMRTSRADTATREQAREAVHGALWEAAGLVLTSADQSGVEFLAGGVERLARADRG